MFKYFLVDLGGTLGLYFGLTILSIFELFIFTFCRNTLDKIQNDDATSKNTTNINLSTNLNLINVKNNQQNKINKNHPIRNVRKV